MLNFKEFVPNFNVFNEGKWDDDDGLPSVHATPRAELSKSGDHLALDIYDKIAQWGHKFNNQQFSLDQFLKLLRNAGINAEERYVLHALHRLETMTVPQIKSFPSENGPRIQVVSYGAPTDQEHDKSPHGRMATLASKTRTSVASQGDIDAKAQTELAQAVQNYKQVKQSLPYESPAHPSISQAANALGNVLQKIVSGNYGDELKATAQKLMGQLQAHMQQTV